MLDGNLGVGDQGGTNRICLEGVLKRHAQSSIWKELV